MAGELDNVEIGNGMRGGENVPPGEPMKFPTKTLPDSYKERFTGGREVEADWGEELTGGYHFAPGSDTFWPHDRATR